MKSVHCELCSPDLSPVLGESAYWRIVLNRRQNLLGKVYLALNRHCEAVAEITPEEWSDLHDQIVRVTSLLKERFQPDHFNFLFLMNQDRHAHIHIVPRYAADRHFGGAQFCDTDWPGAFPSLDSGPSVDPEMEAALTAALQLTHSPS